MSPFEEAMIAAVKLPQAEREHLAQVLGLRLAAEPSTPPPPRPMSTPLPLASNTARLDAKQWRQAERGHAVLATEEQFADREIPTGAGAIAGMWRDRAEGILMTPPGEPGEESTRATNEIELRELPAGSPVLAHAETCFSLAFGEQDAQQFFESPAVEIRLSTAGYLELLGASQSELEHQRLKRFVAPFAVLSLGPMASSRAVELMLENSLRGLTPLDALTAATALAHEIPLVVKDPARFAGIANLTLARI